MTFRRAMSLLATGVMVLSALVGGALVIVRLERDRPRMLLERAGVEIGADARGSPVKVRFPRGLANQDLLIQVSRIGTLASITLVGGEVSPEGLRALGSLPNLRRIDLQQSAGTPDCMREIGRLTSLHELWLNDCQWVTDAGVGRLQTLTQLEFLGLAGTGVGDPGIESLARLPRLTSLNLCRCRNVTDLSLRSLSASTSLRNLVCDGAKMTRPAARAFIASAPGRSLLTDALDVSDLRPLTSAGAHVTLDTAFEVSAIRWYGNGGAGSVDCPSWRAGSAIVDVNPGGPAHDSGASLREAVKLLADSRGLKYLTVQSVALADGDLASLGMGSELRRLELNNCPIRGDGLACLQSHHNLEQVLISSPVLSDEALRQLGRITSLQSLTIRGPHDGSATAQDPRASVTDDGLQSLRALSKLLDLSLLGLPLTGAGLQHLQPLSDLQSLTLNLSQWDPGSLIHVARLSGLHSLSVAGSVSIAGVRSLATVPYLSHLELSHFELDAAVCRELSLLPKLRSLALVDTTLPAEALQVLVSPPTLRQLRLAEVACPDADVQAIRQLRPELQVDVVHGL